MAKQAFELRRPRSADHEEWDRLWQAYLVFYEATLEPRASEVLWQRIHDPQHPIACLVAESADAGGLVGLVHYLPHADTWDERPACYLQDLFVNPAVRGQGIGGALIRAVVAEAKAQGWNHVYWQTRHDNTTARALYDEITGGTDGFVTYRVLDPRSG